LALKLALLGWPNEKNRRDRRGDRAHSQNSGGALSALLALYAVWLLRQPLTTASGRLANFEAFGVKFALSGGTALDAAIELAQKRSDWPVEIPAADRKAALDRANAHRTVFEGAEILWVDDRPSNDRNEARMLAGISPVRAPPHPCQLDTRIDATHHRIHQ
jgi:hypothetical protein